ncbi:unnamed protein product [Tilletia controversa]|nr:unnamed protein product [Tilletia controversa]
MDDSGYAGGAAAVASLVASSLFPSPSSAAAAAAASGSGSASASASASDYFTYTENSGGGFTSDEILSLLPAFSYSLPVQVLVTGINLSICTVILTHLLFTASYHYPLSKHNFLLQLGGATFLIINLATELSIIFAHAQKQSRRYPFGFNYVAVQVPPSEDAWNFVQQFFYLLLRAITVLFVHLTHIQFLTLLFPSRLERRLILWMLGPLALIASGMQFGDFTSTDAQKTSDLLDTLQRISESTLTMLYTCALLIWGLAVNRGRAWRTDGGTAAFGTAACLLALVNTSMAFLELRFDYLHWLPDLTWVVTASQSWLGYWWWVGAGMGIGEVEDRAARAMRKRKRAVRKQRREQSKQAAAAAAAAAREVGSSSAASASGTAGGDSALGSLRRRLGFGAPGSQAGSGSAAAANGGVEGGAGRAESNAGSANGSIPPPQRRTSRTAKSGRNSSGDAHMHASGDVELQEVIIDRAGSGDPLSGTSAQPQQQQQQQRTAHFDDTSPGTGMTRAPSVSGMTTGSGSSNPSSSPANNIFTRSLRTLADIQPAFVRARIDRLRREHALAARRNAREQMDVVERIMGRNPQAGLYRAESRRVPVVPPPPQQGQGQGQGPKASMSSSLSIADNLPMSSFYLTPVSRRYRATSSPSFLVIEVFAFLDPASLTRCTAVSKGWRQLIANDLLWRNVATEQLCLCPATVQVEDLATLPSLRRWSASDHLANLTSFRQLCVRWEQVLLGWRGRRGPALDDDHDYDENDDQPQHPSEVRKIQATSKFIRIVVDEGQLDMWRIKLDPEEGTLIAIMRRGGLYVLDIKTSQVLWQLGIEQVGAYEHLEGERGILVISNTRQGGEGFDVSWDVWVHRRLVPDGGNGDLYQRRSELRLSQGATCSRFKWPVFCAMGVSGTAFFWDLSNPEQPRQLTSIDVSARYAHLDINYIDFDDQHLFLVGTSLGAVILYDRATGQVKWTLAAHLRQADALSLIIFYKLDLRDLLEDAEHQSSPFELREQQLLAERHMNDELDAAIFQLSDIAANEVENGDRDDGRMEWVAIHPDEATVADGRATIVEDYPIVIDLAPQRKAPLTPGSAPFRLPENFEDPPPVRVFASQNRFVGLRDLLGIQGCSCAQMDAANIFAVLPTEALVYPDAEDPGDTREALFEVLHWRIDGA